MNPFSLQACACVRVLCFSITIFLQHSPQCNSRSRCFRCTTTWCCRCLHCQPKRVSFNYMPWAPYSNEIAFFIYAQASQLCHKHVYPSNWRVRPMSTAWCAVASCTPNKSGLASRTVRIKSSRLCLHSSSSATRTYVQVPRWHCISG